MSPLYQEALRIEKSVLGEDHVGYDDSLDGLARPYCANGAYDRGEPLYQEAVRIKKSVIGEEHVGQTKTEVTDVSVTAVALFYQLLSDATLTNTKVTDDSVTAFAQYCRLLSGVTLTNTEVTDVSATAVALYYQ